MAEPARALEAQGLATGLTVVRVGEDPASAVYVRNKIKACAEVGIVSVEHHLPDTTTQAELLALIARLNADPAVHGILVQLPLPKQIAEQRGAGGHLARPRTPTASTPSTSAASGPASRRPRACTPFGVMRLLDEAGVDLKGKHALVVGRSNIVGKPMAAMLLERHATVTIAHSRTADLAAEVARADVVVAAVGKAEMVKGAWVKPGAVVIDVGMNRDADGKLFGDVEFAAAAQRAAAITPVPGRGRPHDHRHAARQHRRAGPADAAVSRLAALAAALIALCAAAAARRASPTFTVRRGAARSPRPAPAPTAAVRVLHLGRLRRHHRQQAAVARAAAAGRTGAPLRRWPSSPATTVYECGPDATARARRPAPSPPTATPWPRPPRRPTTGLRPAPRGAARRAGGAPVYLRARQPRRGRGRRLRRRAGLGRHQAARRKACLEVAHRLAALDHAGPPLRGGRGAGPLRGGRLQRRLRRLRRLHPRGGAGLRGRGGEGLRRRGPASWSATTRRPRPGRTPRTSSPAYGPRAIGRLRGAAAGRSAPCWPATTTTSSTCAPPAALDVLVSGNGAKARPARALRAGHAGGPRCSSPRCARASASSRSTPTAGATASRRRGDAAPLLRRHRRRPLRAGRLRRPVSGARRGAPFTLRRRHGGRPRSGAAPRPLRTSAVPLYSQAAPDAVPRPGAVARIRPPVRPEDPMALRTPLYDAHLRHGARMVEFAGWEMPVQYAGLLEEHQAVRDGGRPLRRLAHGRGGLPRPPGARGARQASSPTTSPRWPTARRSTAASAARAAASSTTWWSTAAPPRTCWSA